MIASSRFVHIMPADPALMTLARGFLEQWASHLADDARGDLVIAFGEALTNAVLHGSPRGISSRVTITFQRDAVSVAVEVQDEGRGFDPEAVPEPDVLSGQEHGFGCAFIRRTTEARWEDNGRRCCIRRAGAGAPLTGASLTGASLLNGRASDDNRSTVACDPAPASSAGDAWLAA